MQSLLFEVAGIIGVTFIVSAYLLLNMQRLTSTSLTYLWLNTVGASLVILSLLNTFNLAAFFLELFWLVISFVGLIRRKKTVASIK